MKYNIICPFCSDIIKNVDKNPIAKEGYCNKCKSKFVVSANDMIKSSFSNGIENKQKNGVCFKKNDNEYKMSEKFENFLLTILFVFLLCLARVLIESNSAFCAVIGVVILLFLLYAIS